MFKFFKSAIVFTAVALFFYAPSLWAQGGRVFDDLYLVARVVVLAGNDSDGKVAEQLAFFRADRAGLEERDIVVIRYNGRTLETLRNLSLFDRNTRVLEARGERIYVEQSLETNGNDFSLILIGKDGGVKTRWREIVQPEVLFSAIDEMPMRQSEIEDEGL